MIWNPGAGKSQEDRFFITGENVGGGTLAFGATLRLHQRLVSVRAVPTRWVEVPKRCSQGAQKVPIRCPFPSCLHLCAQFFQFKAQCLVSLVFRIRRKHICKDKRSTCEKVLPNWFALQCNAFYFSNKDKFLTRIHKVRFPRYILLLSILQTLFELASHQRNVKVTFTF